MNGNTDLITTQYRSSMYAPVEGGGTGGTLLTVIKKQWRTALAVAAVTAAVSVGSVWYSIHPQFKVSANIHVAPTIRPILFNDEETRASGQFTVYLATQAQSIVSPATLQAAVVLPELKELSSIKASKDPAGALQGRITVEQIRGTELLNVSMVGENAQDMVTILGGVLKSYLARLDDDQRRWDDTVLSSMRKEEDDLSQRLAAKMEELKQLMSRLHPGVTASAEGGGVADLRYTELQRQLTQTNTDIVVSKARIESVNSGKGLEAALENEGFEAYRNQDPEYLGLVDQVKEIRVSSFNDPAQGKGPNHPEVLARPARLASLREEIKARVGEVREEYRQIARNRLENKIRDAETTAKALQVEIGVTLSERSDVAQQQIALKAIEDERQRLEQAHMQVRQKVWNVEVEQHRMSRVTLESPPMAPASPNLDRRPKFLAAALVASLFAGLGAAFVRAQLDRGVYEATEVSTRFGLPVLGSVQYLPGANGQGLMRDDRLLESMRVICTALIPPGRARQTRVRLITSPTRGAGKSTVATHVARSLAVSGRKVLIVDADNYGQGATREFGALGTLGFREYLEGRAPIDKIVRADKTENLWVVSSGERMEHFGELLARQTSHERIRALFAGYDEVLVDSAPVLASSSSVILAGLVDEIVLVIRAGRSTNEEVQAARQHLTIVGGKIIGAVLNAVDARGSSYFYSYAYDVEPPKHAHA